MSPRIWIVLGGLLAAIGIGMSAVHAHGLEKMLQQKGFDASEVQAKLHFFETAVRYELYHAMALVVVGLLALHSRSMWFLIAGVLFFCGTILFSGSLYLLALGDTRIPYAAPTGGVVLIVAWLALAIGGLSARPHATP
jgi:uncharacterized membrane protein YgdD (TMEM256/DUF423 family)